MITARLTVGQFDRQDAARVASLVKALDDIGFRGADATQVGRGDGYLRTEWCSFDETLASDVVELQVNYDVQVTVQFK